MKTPKSFDRISLIYS